MPVHAVYDVLNTPPRVAGCRFELAARRLTEEWLARGRVDVSAEVLAFALEFLGRCGFIAEDLAGGDVRLQSDAGRAAVVSREAAMVMALRGLVALQGRSAVRSASAFPTRDAA
jgi:hypothetical protein